MWVFSLCSGHFDIRIKKILNVEPEMKNIHMAPGRWQCTGILKNDICQHIQIYQNEFYCGFDLFLFLDKSILGIPKSNIKKIGQNTNKTDIDKFRYVGKDNFYDSCTLPPAAISLFNLLVEHSVTL